MMHGFQYETGSGIYRHFSDTIWRPLMNSPAKATVIAVFSFFLLVGVILSMRVLDDAFVASKTSKIENKTHSKKLEFPLHCADGNPTPTRTCPTNYYPAGFKPDPENVPEDLRPRVSCPDYFRWIHEDLRPWSRTGITRDMVERANRTADFRLVVVDGRAYVETYQKAFQTRDVFTLWGILQLLRRYPGMIPDLELMFDCVDWPVVSSELYLGTHDQAPPPLFRYCGNDSTLDIVFPDWSYWGWAETNIKPWELLLGELTEGNKRKAWIEREPHAYWKGNPHVAPTREDLLKCNVSDQYDWNARIYAQDWVKEGSEGYKQSDLSNQCMHRYKIYIEGSAWSVSQKYILACDSETLIVKPKYYDFFARGLMPVYHYWPIREDDKCRSLKFAVDWGNSHKSEAQEIGKAASNFIQGELKMDFVYDYMFHLLKEYAKLLSFKPRVPPNAVELCSEAMACPAEGLEKKFKVESLVKGPADAAPCEMPSPFDPAALFALQKRKDESMKQVETWESQYWRSNGHQP